MAGRELVRQSLILDAESTRQIEERIALRLPPSLPALLVELVRRLPPRSRVRRVFTHRTVQLGLHAANRHDFDASFILYDPDVVLITPQRLVGLGFEGEYRGLPARVDFQRRWVEEWGEFRFEPEGFVDFSDGRLFIHGRIAGSGQESGALFESYWAVLLTLRRGLVVQEKFFFDRESAREAVGPDVSPAGR